MHHIPRVSASGENAKTNAMTEVTTEFIDSQP